MPSNNGLVVEVGYLRDVDDESCWENKIDAQDSPSLERVLHAQLGG